MTVDLQAMRLLQNGTVVQSLADPTFSGDTVAGFDKLTQRVVSRLMTPRGSVPYLANLGTNFVNRLRSGNLSTEHDVFVVFASVQTELTSILASEEDELDPADEKFKSLVLNSLVLQIGELTLNLKLSDQAGTTRDIKLPIRFQLR